MQLKVFNGRKGEEMRLSGSIGINRRNNNIIITPNSSEQLN